MFSDRKVPQKPAAPVLADTGKPAPAITLLTVVGQHARMEGKFDIADSIQIECEVGGELIVGGKLVIGEKGVVNADVQTVDAIIMGHYEGNMIASGNVEIAETGHVSGNIQTDSLVISKGGFFNGNITKMNETVVRQVVAIEEKRPNQQFAAR
ncbi:MAG TPA: polymer-forming cytoskeletal protein [Gemmatimonadaceae bacterium]|nr:polymer-forming cytoskeletal protein [Gemmatimonadaceae bacterium]